MYVNYHEDTHINFELEFKYLKTDRELKAMEKLFINKKNELLWCDDYKTKIFTNDYRKAKYLLLLYIKLLVKKDPIYGYDDKEDEYINKVLETGAYYYNKYFDDDYDEDEDEGKNKIFEFIPEDSIRIIKDEIYYQKNVETPKKLLKVKLKGFYSPEELK